MTTIPMSTLVDRRGGVLTKTVRLPLCSTMKNNLLWDFQHFDQHLIPLYLPPFLFLLSLSPFLFSSLPLPSLPPYSFPPSLPSFLFPPSLPPFLPPLLNLLHSSVVNQSGVCTSPSNDQFRMEAPGKCSEVLIVDQTSLGLQERGGRREGREQGEKERGKGSREGIKRGQGRVRRKRGGG